MNVFYSISASSLTRSSASLVSCVSQRMSEPQDCDSLTKALIVPVKAGGVLHPQKDEEMPREETTKPSVSHRTQGLQDYCQVPSRRNSQDHSVGKDLEDH